MIWAFSCVDVLLPVNLKIVQKYPVGVFALEYELDVVEDVRLKAGSLHVPAGASLYCPELDIPPLSLLEAPNSITAVVFMLLRPD